MSCANRINNERGGSRASMMRFAQLTTSYVIGSWPHVALRSKGGRLLLKETKMPFRYLEIVVLLFVFEHKHFSICEAGLLGNSIRYTLGFTKFELRNLS